MLVHPADLRVLLSRVCPCHPGGESVKWGPSRGIAVGGISFGVLLLVVGVVFFLVNQRIINITFDFWTVCSLGLIVLGVIVLGGTIWARRMMREGWSEWKPEDRPRP